MKNVFPFFLILLVSCGADYKFEDKVQIQNVNDLSEVKAHKQTNPVFHEYVDQLEAEIAQETGLEVDLSYIPVNFGDIRKENNRHIGVCRKWKNKQGQIVKREILIDEAYWSRASDADKEILINHEFGHCHFDRSHDNCVHKGIARSIMNKTHIGDEHYNTFQNSYIVELITGNKEKITEDIESL